MPNPQLIATIADRKTRSSHGRSGTEKTVLTIGIKGNRELIVTEELTAQAIGSGELPVLATPAVIAMAEETAWRSVAAFLEPGQGTVGTKLDVEHISATPVGMKVKCETELTEIDRRKLTFSEARYYTRLTILLLLIELSQEGHLPSFPTFGC